MYVIVRGTCYWLLMKIELRQIERYLGEALGIDVSAKSWQGKQLPHFLREHYEFAKADVLSLPCLFLMDTATGQASPGTIRKHLQFLRTVQNREAVYVRPQVSAYNRKRLIEQRVPFIVPGNQLYLPMLGIDLREHFRAMREPAVTFSPATQVVVIHALLHDRHDDLNPLDMARRLGYSAMTLTRAFDELESAQFATTAMRGRRRRLRFSSARKETWARAQRFLRSPVARRLFIDHRVPVEGIRAGLTALAEYSMLSPPAHTTLAISKAQWGGLRDRHKVVSMSDADPESREVQVWNYAPALFARRNIVDPLSLYLSLKDDGDERVQESLEAMMKELGW